MTGAIASVWVMIRFSRPELSQKFSLLNRILVEKAGNEDGIEIRSNLNDRAIRKSTYPAIPVIEPETVFGGGFRMQFDHRPVGTYEHMFHMQFRTFGQNLCQLFKRMFEELGFAVIV